MLTREGTGTAVLAVAIFLLATNLGSGLMFVLDALLVSLLAVGALTATMPLRAITARRVAPDRVTEGADVAIEVSVMNGGRANVGSGGRWPGARFGAGPRLWSIEDGWAGARGRGVAPVSLDARPAVSAVVVEAARRGKMHFGPIVIGSRGALGLVAARRRFAVPGETVVWPRVHAVAGPVRARLAALGTNARRTRQVAEFHGLRDYRHGDALGRVHWRSSMRRGAPVVREFEMPSGVGTAVVIDLDRRQDPARLDSAVRATASLLYHLMMVERQPATLIGWSETLVRWREWEPAMDWLAEVTPCGPPIATVLSALQGRGYDALAVASTAFAPPSDGTVVVTPLGDLAGTPPRGYLTYDADGRVSVW